MASPSPSQIAYQQAHIHDDKRAGIIASNIICLATAYIAVVLRFTSRRIAKVSIRADDWWIIVGLILTTGYVISYFITVHFGMGRHALLITNLPSFIKCVIADETIYTSAIIGVKFSILFLYRRIFPQRWFKYAVLALGAFILAYSITQTLGVIFQCVPVQSLWRSDMEKKCIDIDNFMLAMSIVNLWTELLMLGLPMPLLWNLQASKTQRLSLIGMFSLGGIVVIVSVARLFYVKKAGIWDASWEDVNVATLSVIETCVGIISACLPTYRPLLKHVRRACSTSDITQGTRSSDFNSINLSKAQSSWNKSLDTKNEDQQRLYSRAEVTTDVEGGLSDGPQYTDPGNNIIVTSEFRQQTSSS